MIQIGGGQTGFAVEHAQIALVGRSLTGPLSIKKKSLNLRICCFSWAVNHESRNPVHRRSTSGPPLTVH